jgi:hypothetical protein
LAGEFPPPAASGGTSVQQLVLFALLTLGMLESLANGVLSATDALRVFFHAENCLFVRKQLRVKTADAIMSHGVQLPDLFVVMDDYPSFFLPRMVAAAVTWLPVRLEQVDSNGLLPLRAAGRVFTTAHAFRRFVQKEPPAHLDEFPRRNPFACAKLPALDTLPHNIVQRWPPA